MKKILFILSIVVVFASCSKDGPILKEVEKNVLVNTKWQTEDVSANALLGGVNIQVIEFKTETSFEVNRYRNSAFRENLYKGTYTVKDKKINMKYQYEGKDREWNLEFVNADELQRTPTALTFNTYTKQ